jgi:hypothetical protein
MFTGAGGVGRQQSFLRLSKNRSVWYGFNGRGDFTASAAFRPTRVVVTGLVPGSYRSTGSALQVPGVTRGLTEGTKRPGSCERYQPPAQHRGGSFRPHCRVSMPLLTEGVPSARHRTGGRPAFTG